jgi:hypothetical protein
MCLVASIVLLFTSVCRSVLGVVGWTIAFLLAIALLTNMGAMGSWLPASVGDLVQGPPGDIWRAIVVAGVGTALALAAGVRLLERRKVSGADG